MIQTKKYTIEEIMKIFNHWVRWNKTSWKWTEKKGLSDAEDLGDCIFLNPFYSETDKDAIKDFQDKLENFVCFIKQENKE